MTTTTTTRATDTPRPAHRPPAKGFVAAAGGIITAIAAGFLAILAFPATASARVIDPYLAGTAPTAAAAPVPAPVSTASPEPSGWSVTTIVSFAVIAAVVLGVALVVQRAAHRRHDSNTPALAG